LSDEPAENSAQSPIITPNLPVPQANGRGALYRGGVKGNKGGGRPKDQVRAKLTKLANGKGLRFLNKLMDGEVEVQLVGECPHCHETTDMDAKWLTIASEAVHTSVEHRLKGNEQALKYGIGIKDEVDVKSHPDVQRLIGQGSTGNV